MPKGAESGLTSKLSDALKLLDKGNANYAIHKLMDFMSQIEALLNKKLTEGEADILIEKAQEIIYHI